VPKSRGGSKGEYVILHEICHKHIHALFDPRELDVIYNTISKLKNHSDIKRFVRWISNKPTGFNTKIRIRRKRR